MGEPCGVPTLRSYGSEEKPLNLSVTCRSVRKDFSQPTSSAGKPLALKTARSLWWFMLSKKPEMSKSRDAQTSPLAWAVRMSCWRHRPASTGVFFLNPASTVEDAFLPPN